MDFVASESLEIDAFLEEQEKGLAVPKELWPLRQAATELRYGDEEHTLATWLLQMRWRSLLWPLTAAREGRGGGEKVEFPCNFHEFR